MLSFENPAALLLLFSLILIVLLYRYSWESKKKLLEFFRIPHITVRKGQIKKCLVAVVLVGFIIFAMTLPKSMITTALSEKTGEIILMVDVTRSMAAQTSLDNPNRLERSKTMMIEVVGAFPSVRFALYGFTEMARDHVPFVSGEDHRYLVQSIQRVLEVGSVPGAWSEFERPLRKIMGKFSEDAPAKLILLFSDGEQVAAYGRSLSFSESLRGVLRELDQQGIKLIVIGVGEKDGATIPVYDRKGQFTGEYATLGDQIYISYLKEDVLQALAQGANGRYFNEQDFSYVIPYVETCLASVGTVQRLIYHQDIAILFLLPVVALWIIFSRYYFK